MVLVLLLLIYLAGLTVGISYPGRTNALRLTITVCVGLGIAVLANHLQFKP
jgi:hypothetical protein